MFFSNLHSRMALLLLSLFLISTENLFADTVTKEATFYSDSFDGSSTSNGDRFSQNTYSAAVCGVDLGQYLYVSKWGKGIVVKANDRPNCTKYPNIIDLSREAFRVLGSLTFWRIADISVTPIGWAPASAKWFFSADTFSHLGIVLDSEVPTVLFAGDDIEIRGHVTDGKKYALLYIARNDESWEHQNTLIPVDTSGKFRTSFSLPRSTGQYTFIIASGNSFNTDKFSTLELIDRSTLVYPDLPSLLSRISPRISMIWALPSIFLPANTWAELLLTQDGKIWKISGTSLVFDTSWLSLGKAQVNMSGYKLSTASSLDRSARVDSFFSGSVILDRVHESKGMEKIKFRSTVKWASFSFLVPQSPRIRDTYYITFPNGDAEEYHFPKNLVDEAGNLIPGKRINIPFEARTPGNYFVEVVAEDGLAYINTPFTRGNVWSIIQPLTEVQITTIRRNKDTVKSSIATRINTLRLTQDRGLLTIDDTLSRLAQAKVDDMIARKYQAHRDPDGNYIDGFAKKQWITISTALGENIAYGDISDLALQDGLEESGSHRHNMLNPQWKKVGIGYGIFGKNTYIVHIFGE